ncbi:MAG: TIM barrel protein [Gemmatimonadaceae bacterium]
MLLGAHLSTAGGVRSALPRAEAVGATAMQIFTKHCSQWKEPLIDADTGADFQKSARKLPLGSTNAHDSYLINLASPELVPGRTRLLLETTADTGTALGASFEELAELIERVGAPLNDRIGICVDTCHVFAAGYDLVSDYDGVLARLEDTVGLHRLGLIHLNDSKMPLGSRRDRHELIGEGR